MKNTTTVQVVIDRGETTENAEFYVRSVRKAGWSLRDPRAGGRDAWAAYVERGGKRGERVSDAPRATVEEALMDMYVAAAGLLSREGRLVYGALPEDLDARWQAARELSDASRADPDLESDLSDA